MEKSPCLTGKSTVHGHVQELFWHNQRSYPIKSHKTTIFLWFSYGYSCDVGIFPCSKPSSSFTSPDPKDNSPEVPKTKDAASWQSCGLVNHHQATLKEIDVHCCGEFRISVHEQILAYPLVIKNGNGKGTIEIGDFPIKISTHWGSPIAMFDYQRVLTLVHDEPMA